MYIALYKSNNIPKKKKKKKVIGAWTHLQQACFLFAMSQRWNSNFGSKPY